MSKVALYRAFARDDSLLYVGISKTALSRLSAHSNTSKWFDTLSRVDIEWLPSREDALIAERAAINGERPKFNIMHSQTSRIVVNKSGASKKLRNVLARTGMLQQDLAEAAGISGATVSRLLSGDIKDPAISVVLAIQKATRGAMRPEDWK